MTPDQWEEYESEGFVALGPTLDKTDLQALLDRIRDIMLGNLRYPGMLMQLDIGGDYTSMPQQTREFKGPRLDYRKIQDLEKDPLFRAFLEKPVFLEACGQVYPGAEGLSIYRAMIMNKPAKGGTDLPWHQDGGETWNVAPDPLLTAWTALTPSQPESGCLQVIRGSHKLGLLSKKGHLLSERSVKEHCEPGLITDLPAEPGETYLLHNFLIHRSGTNATSIPRMAFSVCYMDGKTRHRSFKNAFPAVFERPGAFPSP